MEYQQEDKEQVSQFDPKDRDEFLALFYSTLDFREILAEIRL